MSNQYKVVTVQDLVNMIEEHPEIFKKGMDTPVCSGDYEGNITHKKHELMREYVKGLGTTLFLTFEFHNY